MNDEFKKLTKCLFDINCAEKRLVEELSSSTTATSSDDDRLKQLIARWNELVSELTKNRQDLASNMHHTVIEPQKKFDIAFREMKNAVKRYEELTGDCARYQQKLTEYQRADRTSNTIVKVNKYESLLSKAQNDCNVLRTCLERELPVFLNKRIDYFQPSLSAFICSGILTSGNNLSALKELELVNRESSDTDLEQQNSQLFESIKNLSIVS